MSDLGPARSIVSLATKINSEHVAFSYCACSTSYSGWAYNRVKIPSRARTSKQKRGWASWAFIQDGLIFARVW